MFTFSGCLLALSSIECVGAVLLPEALDSGKVCAAFGMCAACRGHIVGLYYFKFLSV